MLYFYKYINVSYLTTTYFDINICYFNLILTFIHLIIIFVVFYASYK